MSIGVTLCGRSCQWLFSRLPQCSNAHVRRKCSVRTLHIFLFFLAILTTILSIFHCSSCQVFLNPNSQISPPFFTYFFNIKFTIFSTVFYVFFVGGMAPPPTPIFAYRLKRWSIITTKDILPGDLISLAFKKRSNTPVQTAVIVKKKDGKEGKK